MNSTQFSGLNILITGASSGIGKAFAEELAKRGANLILSSRSEDTLDQLSVSLKIGRENSVTVIPCDLSDSDGAKRLFSLASPLGVDVLINCAGFGKWDFFQGQSMATYEEMIRLNILALVELNYLFLPEMDVSKMVGVINVASTAAFQPIPYQAVYAASKSFVLNFSEALAGEYEDRGVRIVALCPGYTDTNFMKVANGYPKGMPCSTAEDVVESALLAFSQRKSFVVPGLANYLNSLLPRILTRKMVLKTVTKMFKKRVLLAQDNSYQN